MNKDEKVVDGTQTATTETKKEAVVVEPTAEEKRIAELEAENARLIDEGANWKVAALKAKGKNADEDLDEGPDDRVKRIVAETLRASKLEQNNVEKDELIKKVLKENQELRLAQANKTTTPPVAVGSHTEGIQVQDTLITPEQMAAFKARGWDDKKIERYKKNLARVSGR